VHLHFHVASCLYSLRVADPSRKKGEPKLIGALELIFLPLLRGWQTSLSLAKMAKMPNTTCTEPDLLRTGMLAHSVMCFIPSNELYGHVSVREISTQVINLECARLRYFIV